MKTVGIIAEYNPLHNGHRYQLQKARQMTDADFVIVVMSGDFVQRGEPAIYDKYTRTRMALNAGADLVLEIPSCFAVGSAEDFASCTVSLLSRLGVIDALCFGSECGDTAPLIYAAKILAEEPPEYKELLKIKLADGKSFPLARTEALMTLISQNEPSADFDIQSSRINWKTLLSSPNNILGMEYCKALIRQHSKIQPITIRRRGAGYHDLDLSSDESAFASASAIRKALQEGNLDAAQKQMPDFSGQMTDAEQTTFSPVFANDLSELLNYRLLDLHHSAVDLTTFSDVSKELADRLNRQLLDFDSFEGRIHALKTRQYTYTRVSRALLHILLGIRDDDMQTFRAGGYAQYAKVLGFKKNAVSLLSEIKSHSTIPLISKVANAGKILKDHPDAWRAFQYDLHTAHIYQMIQYQKCGERKRNEYTQTIRPFEF
ncbi:MAG: nucleotidyltransferase [Brotaphodocola sp.]